MKPVIGVALLVILLLALLSIALHWKTTPNQALVLAQGTPTDVPQPDTSLTAAKTTPPRGPIAPEIVSDTWLNSPPLTAEELRGKVVLVEFWTFDCINCRNTIPYIRALYEKYRERGLVVVGVHTPELSFEHELTNVKAAIKDQSIAYPVAIDNDYTNWNAFKVWAWPTWFILDKQGAIRFTHVGEGAYAESEQIITELLKE